MQQYIADNGARFSYLTLDGPEDCIFIWAHGWAQSHRDLLPLAESLNKLGRHYLIDLPGFGDSPRPEDTWGTDQYADFLADWLNTLPAVPKIWIGHSFGCRIGIRLAVDYSQLVNALFLIAAPGLPRKISIWRRSVRFLRSCITEPLKLLLPTSFIEKVRKYVGSPDYRNAGAMRDIFLATISEDLSDVSSQICCNTQLMYGELDTETPAEFGRRYLKLIPNSTLTILPHLDHYTVLTEGRHQILTQLKTLRHQII